MSLSGILAGELLVVTQSATGRDVLAALAAKTPAGSNGGERT